MKVHLVDDDRLYHCLMKDFFEENNIKYEMYGSGVDFLSLNTFQISDIEFLILDHSILDVDSIGLLRTFRKINPNAKVCMISTYGNAVELHNILDLDITCDSRKIDLDKILSWINKYKTALI